ncbi:MAG TPA: cupin domain-containing protein [Kofleriaceae bacterium]|nr:cupin domain-containing protein [Kofleriaceae bacterium]
MIDREPLEPPGPDARVEPGLTSLLGADAARALVDDAWPDRALSLAPAAARLAAAVALVPPAALPLLQAAAWKEIRIFLPDDRGAIASCLVSPQQAWKLLRRGVTLELYHMERDQPGLGRLAGAVEHELGLPAGACEVQAFVSRAGRGFPLHFDKTEVLTVQLAGRKRWRIGEPDVAYPTVGSEAGCSIKGEMRDYWPADLVVDQEHRPRGERELVLEPGAALFLPRGHWHRTETVDDESISLALVLSTPTRADLLLAELRRRILRQPAWRATCAPGRAAPSAHRRASASAIAELIAALPAEIDRIEAGSLAGADTPEE